MPFPPSEQTRKQMDEFLASLMVLDYPYALLKIQDEATRIKRNGEKYGNNHEYLEELRGLGFFLANSIKPHGISNDSFQKFKPFFQELVRKEQLLPSVMEIFEKPEHQSDYR